MRASEREEGSVDVVADLPAETHAAEPVQVSEGPSHDPALRARAGAVPGPAPTPSTGTSGKLVRKQSIRWPASHWWQVRRRQTDLTIEHSMS